MKLIGSTVARVLLVVALAVGAAVLVGVFKKWGGRLLPGKSAAALPARPSSEPFAAAPGASVPPAAGDGDAVEQDVDEAMGGSMEEGFDAGAPVASGPGFGEDEDARQHEIEGAGQDILA